MAYISTGELAWAFSQGQSLSWQTLGMGWEGLCLTCPRGLLCSCVSGEQWQSGGGGGGGAHAFIATAAAHTDVAAAPRQPQAGWSSPRQRPHCPPLKPYKVPGMVIHVCNHSGGRGRGASVSSRPPWSTSEFQNSSRTTQRSPVSKNHQPANQPTNQSTEQQHLHKVRALKSTLIRIENALKNVVK